MAFKIDSQRLNGRDCLFDQLTRFHKVAAVKFELGQLRQNNCFTIQIADSRIDCSCLVEMLKRFAGVTLQALKDAEVLECRGKPALISDTAMQPKRFGISLQGLRLISETVVTLGDIVERDGPPIGIIFFSPKSKRL